MKNIKIYVEIVIKSIVLSYFRVNIKKRFPKYNYIDDALLGISINNTTFIPSILSPVNSFLSGLKTCTKGESTSKVDT